MFNSGIRGRRARDGEGTVNSSEQFVQQNYTVPYISRFAVTSGSYVDIDDTAADTAGGQTIVLYGNGFKSGATVMVGSTTIGVVTVLDSNRITFTSPALSAGSYTVYVINSNGGTGVLLPGLIYSGMPSFTTAAGNIGSYIETQTVSNTIVATEGADPITYTLASGTLPPGATLYANGVITGTSQLTSNSTTYTFTIRATDSELQDSTRQFTITVNPDLVTWNSPADGAQYNIPNDVLLSNVSLLATNNLGSAISYTANTLPTGLSITGNVINGTPTGYNAETTVTTLLTATANASTRFSTRTISWVVLVNDANFYRTVALLQNDTTTFAADASTTNSLITVQGDTVPSRFSPYLPNGWSNYFDGTGDYLSFTGKAIGNGNFTLECWIFATTAPSDKSIFEGRSNGTGTAGFTLTAFSSSVIRIWTGTSAAISSSSTSYINRWCHVAVSRVSGTTTLYINGISQGTSTALGNLTDTTFLIGAGKYATPPTIDAFFTGYISNFRITTGTAVYTTNFYPSLVSLLGGNNVSLLTCATARIEDVASRATITRNGDVKVSAFNPFDGNPHTQTPLGYSVYFDGTGDSLSVTRNTAFLPGANEDFTFEAWVHLIAIPGAQNAHIMGFTEYGTDGDWVFGINSSRQLYFYMTSTFGTYLNTSTLVNINQWTHVAVSRSGTGSNNLKLFVNGVGQGHSVNNTTVGTGNRNLSIGADQDSDESNLFGYISNLRMIKGTGLYTANFTPSTTSLTTVANTSLLTCQSTTIIDNSTNNFTITTNGDAVPTTNNPFGYTITSTNSRTTTGNSIYFDGNGDRLTIGTSTSLALGAGDFTFEFWIYVMAYNASSAALVEWRTAGNAPVDIPSLFLSSTGVPIFYGTAGSALITSSKTLALTTWYHVAVSRSGSTVTMYIDGIPVASATASNNYGIQTLSLNDPQGSYYAHCYMSNFRIVKGTAVYTQPFIPSTGSLTAIANTAVLTGHTTTLIDGSTNNFTLTAVGDTQVSSFSPFTSVSTGSFTYTSSTYGASAYFDGSGDYLTVPANSGFSFGTGDFTVEFWAYTPPFSNTNGKMIVDSRPDSTNGSYWNFGFNGSGFISFTTMTSGGVTLLSSTAHFNQWVHYAASRSGTNLKLFVNGKIVATAINSDNISSSGLFIGRNAFSGSSPETQYLGYISDLRIIKGTAIYTIPFIPPTAPLTAVANTTLLTLQSDIGTNSIQFADQSKHSQLFTRTGNLYMGSISPLIPGRWSVFFPNSGYVNTQSTAGAYVTVPNSTQFDITSNDFTLEGWIYPMTIPASDAWPTNWWQHSSLFGRGSPNGGDGYNLILGATKLLFQNNDVNIINGTHNIVINRWYHVAVSRASGTLRLFVNGTQIASTTYTSSMGAGSTFYIGCETGQGAYFNGYMSNLRLVINEGLYTANFTPSTTSLSTTANTKLLTFRTGSLIDESPFTQTVSVASSISVVPYGPFNPNTITNNGYSLQFDGSGDYLTISNSTGLFTFGTNSFTVEAWVYMNVMPSSNDYPGGFWILGGGQSNNAIGLDFNIGSTNIIGSLNNYSARTIEVAHNMTTNRWYHVAYVRNSNTFTIYINGNSVGSANVSGVSADPMSSGIAISAAEPSGATQGNFNGCISNLRIVRGRAVYTSNFTPSTASLTSVAGTILLTAQSDSIIDNSPNNFSLTVFGETKPVKFNPFGENIVVASSHYNLTTHGGSVYFDGSDYLTITDNPAMNLANNVYTIDMWIWPTGNYTNYNTIISKRSSDSSCAWQIYLRITTGVLSSFNNAVNLESSVAPTPRAWNHIAMVYDSGNVNLYLNGKRVLQSTQGNTDIASNVYFGNYPTWNEDFKGYISNLRIIKGRALYTGPFIPYTTAPNAFVDNTALLFNFTNNGITDASGSIILESIGNVRTANNIKKYGSGSLYFDGSGDRLVSPANNTLSLAYGDFTVELWVYPLITNAFQAIIYRGASSYTSGSDLQWYIFITAAGQAGIRPYQGTTDYTTTIGAISANTWSHIAFVRSGNTFMGFLNGVKSANTQTISGNLNDNGDWPGLIMGYGILNGSADGQFNGYIDDIRITRGHARYTVNFTPPSLHQPK